jgi:NAD(P)-dependent dehydrogenase (short-subunit alcohol dehydrogenase family)
VVTRRFATDGARLVLVGTDRTRLEEVADEVALADDAWGPALGDLRDPAAGRSVGAAAEERFGRVDVLVHLIGGYEGGTAVADLDHDELRRMLDQHLWTTLNIVQAVVPGMAARGYGRVLGVTSSLADRPGPRGASYAIAKSAEEVLIRSLARETAGQGITANLVVVRTIDVQHARETDPSPKNASHTTPEEIADVLAFLASPAAGAITGARVPLDGRG